MTTITMMRMKEKETTSAWAHFASSDVVGTPAASRGPLRRTRRYDDCAFGSVAIAGRRLPKTSTTAGPTTTSRTGGRASRGRGRGGRRSYDQGGGGAGGGMEPRWPKQAPNAIEPQAHGSSSPVVSVPWSTQAPAAVPAGTSLQVTTPLQLHKSKGPRAPQASSSPLLPTSPPIPQRQPISTDAPGQSHHQHPHAHGTEQRSRGWLMYLWLYSLQRTRSVRSYCI